MYKSKCRKIVFNTETSQDVLSTRSQEQLSTAFSNCNISMGGELIAKLKKRNLFDLVIEKFTSVNTAKLISSINHSRFIHLSHRLLYTAFLLKYYCAKKILKPVQNLSNRGSVFLEYFFYIHQK